MSHFIELCKKCGKVISQCRCMAGDKEKRYSVCKECKEKEKENEV
jgi:hypothetical protein